MTARPAPPPEGAPFGPEDFAAAMGAWATPRVLDDLERFRRMVEARNAVMNLVGPATLPDWWRRHALDSAQLVLHVKHGGLTWADLGAGAGFPGVVLAVLLKDRPGARVHLVDSLTKRCRFLQEAVEALDLPAEVHVARAETLSLAVDTVTARACAPMEKLLGYAAPYLKRGAEGLFLKGENVAAELLQARKSWRFDDELVPSISDPRGRIVRIRRFARAA